MNNKRINRRGQAALEFLTTYGWAFLIILVMIGAISYFGITNPGMFIPDRCTFSSELVCEDFQIAYVPGANEASVVIVSLKQTIGRTIYLANFSCKGPDGTIAEGFYHGTDVADQALYASSGTFPLGTPADEEWEPREPVFLKCLFTDAKTFEGLEEERIRIPVTASFRRRASGFVHMVEGDVTATVVKG